jgi:hypothetical protein
MGLDGPERNSNLCSDALVARSMHDKLQNFMLTAGKRAPQGEICIYGKRAARAFLCLYAPGVESLFRDRPTVWPRSACRGLAHRMRQAIRRTQRAEHHDIDGRVRPSARAALHGPRATIQFQDSARSHTLVLNAFLRLCLADAEPRTQE